MNEREKNIASQRGITIIALIITIIIILILTATSVTYTNKGTDFKQYRLMCEDIKLLEDKVLIYYNEYGQLPITGDAVDVSNIIESENDFYELDKTKISNLTLNYGNADDKYLIDTVTFKVYYQKGTELQGNVYYSAYYED